MLRRLLIQIIYSSWKRDTSVGLCVRLRSGGEVLQLHDFLNTKQLFYFLFHITEPRPVWLQRHYTCQAHPEVHTCLLTVYRSISDAWQASRVSLYQFSWVSFEKRNQIKRILHTILWIIEFKGHEILDFVLRWVSVYTNLCYYRCWFYILYVEMYFTLVCISLLLFIIIIVCTK